MQEIDMSNINKMVAECNVDTLNIAFVVGETAHCISKADSWVDSLNLAVNTIYSIISARKEQDEDLDLFKVAKLIHGAIDQVIVKVGGEGNDAE